MNHKTSLIWLTMFVVAAVMFTKLPPMIAGQDSVVRTFSPLVEVDALARKFYIDPVDESRLVEGALRGMLSELDPYSDYLSPEHLEIHRRLQRGEYVGVGIEIAVLEGELTVVTATRGGPASEAGVRPGDVIEGIDDRDARRLSLFAADVLLNGPEGEAVELAIRSREDRQLRRISLVRRAIDIQTVTGVAHDADGKASYFFDPQRRHAYIRITRFAEPTHAEFQAALQEVLAGSATGLVLDLRGNAGGLMRQALSVLDHFIAEGPLLSTVTRRQAVHDYTASGLAAAADLPLVVLIDGASASAAEIVAGVLQDRGRALVVGERSFGKGSVQQLIHLTENAGAVKLTTAYYRLPSGRKLHRGPMASPHEDWGVRPDQPMTWSRDIRPADSPVPEAVRELLRTQILAAGRR
jgi:carboxyl-terminal processing protease